MVTIEVCVGSSCFLRGASDVIKAFEAAIGEHAPRQVKIKGTFCQESCTKGVTVRIDDELFAAVSPPDVPRLFRDQVMPRLRNDATGNADEG